MVLCSFILKNFNVLFYSEKLLFDRFSQQSFIWKTFIHFHFEEDIFYGYGNSRGYSILRWHFSKRKKMLWHCLGTLMTLILLSHCFWREVGGFSKLCFLSTMFLLFPHGWFQVFMFDFPVLGYMILGIYSFVFSLELGKFSWICRLISFINFLKSLDFFFLKYLFLSFF